MRVQYVPVTEKEWVLHFQRGSGFSGSAYQRGAGLGSIFRSLFRAILPVAKSAGRAIGKRALKAGAEIATDLINGQSPEQTVKRRGRQAATDLLEKAAIKLRGGKIGSIKGKKKATPVTRKKPQKKRVTQIGITRG